MEGRCDKHPFEPMERHCRACGGEFCGDCLVFAYGPKKPPYCVSCALSAAGVRSTAARRQVRSKRDIKREEREQRRMEKAAAKARTAVTAESLLDAQPIGAGPAPGPTGPTVEFEMTINDDGSVARETKRSIFDQTPIEEQVG